MNYREIISNSANIFARIAYNIVTFRGSGRCSLGVESSKNKALEQASPIVSKTKLVHQLQAFFD